MGHAVGVAVGSAKNASGRTTAAIQYRARSCTSREGRGCVGRSWKVAWISAFWLLPCRMCFRSERRLRSSGLSPKRSGRRRRNLDRGVPLWP